LPSSPFLQFEYKKDEKIFTSDVEAKKYEELFAKYKNDDDVKKYMNQTIRDVSDKVINATVTPFMNGIKGVLGKIDSSWGKDKIKEELQNCLDKLKEGATDDIYGQGR
jgi:hypothetical protein